MESLVEGQNVAGEYVLARDDRGLQAIIKRFKNLAGIQKEWNEAGVTASRTTTFQTHPGGGQQLSGSSGQATSEPEPT